MKRRAVKPDEIDVVTGWRKLLCYMQRPGNSHKAKRRMRRRERHQGKHRLSQGGDEC